ncbi:MAG: efflux transporter outer membrane subunit [Sphingomonas sp.]|nr:efflux transporter outer membrane subunit [Sphingomonas sp.]
MVGPDHVPGTVQMPATYEHEGRSASQPFDLRDWWTGWNDPFLNDLIRRGLTDNLDVAQAASRVRQARIQVTIAGAANKPQIDAEGQGSYTKLSSNAPLGSLSGGSAGDRPGRGRPGSDFTSFRAGFDASWEIDLFGGGARSVQAAKARADAAEWSRRDAQVMIAAEIADAYFQYLTLGSRTALADADLRARRELLDFINVRIRSGLVTTLDARREEREIATAVASRAALQAEREGLRHALGILIGTTPEALRGQLAADAPLPSANRQIPAGLPSELLRRRPDIRAAERRLSAANADIGVATADLFPKLNLTGALELVSTALASPLSTDSIQATAAAGLSLPLLDGGRRRATVKLREELYRENELAYRATVFGALRDVEDALSRSAADRLRAASLRAGAAAARDALDTTRVRYRAGLTPFLDVLDAESASIAAADTLARAETDARRDMIALYKALGGGWSEEPKAKEQDR